MTVELKNDANWLIIRVPRMYADKVQALSISRIINEAIRLLDHFGAGEIDADNASALYYNVEELELIRLPVDAFSNAVREGFQLEQNAQQTQS